MEKKDFSEQEAQDVMLIQIADGLKHLGFPNDYVDDLNIEFKIVANFPKKKLIIEKRFEVSNK